LTTIEQTRSSEVRRTGISECAVPVPEFKVATPTTRDVLKNNGIIVLRATAVFVTFLALWTGSIPLWLYFVLQIIVYPDHYLRLHDLAHGFSDRQVWFFAKHPMVADPFWGGMLVFKDTHLDHHRYFATDRDPWLHLYDKSPVHGAFWSLFESELFAWQYVKKHGLKPIFVREVLFHATCMTVNAIVFGPIYWLHVITLRVIRAVSIFYFNYWVHRSHLGADAEYGVYEREKNLWPGFKTLIRVVWGNDVLSGLIYHNRHHCLKYWKLQIQYYPIVKDSGQYTTYIKQWPVAKIYPMAALEANASELQ
jgi:hypothetical protein